MEVSLEAKERFLVIDHKAQKQVSYLRHWQETGPQGGIKRWHCSCFLLRFTEKCLREQWLFSDPCSLSCSCFQLALPVFLLSNYAGVDTNQREWEKAVERVEANCFKSFVLLSGLYTFLLELLALTFSIPVDTAVGNRSLGMSDFWSCSPLLVTSQAWLFTRSLNFLCSDACIWPPVFLGLSLPFLLKSLPPISL